MTEEQRQLALAANRKKRAGETLTTEEVEAIRVYDVEKTARSRRKKLLEEAPELTQKQLDAEVMLRLTEREEDLLWELNPANRVMEDGTVFEVKDDAKTVAQIESFLRYVEADLNGNRRPFAEVRQILSTSTVGRMVLRYHNVPPIGKDFKDFVSSLESGRSEVGEIQRRMEAEQRMPEYATELAQLEERWRERRSNGKA